jgi:hypothetical protein
MSDASHTEYTFTAVPPELVDVVWSDAGPILAQAVETSGGRYTIDAVYEALKVQHIALWLVLDQNAKIVAALTTRVVQLPTTRMMAMDWLAGKDMKAWLPMVQKTLEQYGKEYGCTEMQAYGRKAWGRVLGRHGWVLDTIQYKKDI